MFTFGLVIIVVEALEHILKAESLLTVHFLTEVIIYGITIPALGAVLLNWVDRIETDRDQAIFELDQFDEFNRQLRSTENLNDVVEQIGQFTKSILPVQSMMLNVVGEDEQELIPVKTWGPNSSNDTDTHTYFPLDECRSCSRALYSLNSEVQKCLKMNQGEGIGNTHFYCLPLNHQGNLAGILHLDLDNNASITKQQIDSLTRLVPEFTLALENVRLQEQIRNQSLSATAERQRISRDLHDTLGQNLSYIRLKLDQISSEGTLQNIAEIQKDIERMRDTAAEAYDQMYATLADLQPDSQLELDKALRTHAEIVSTRASLKFIWTIQGQPLPLGTHIKRQTLYIFREALNNVEKHANATLVEINLDWGKHDLTIKIRDDGCGFNPKGIYGHQHFGLRIMSERAEEINGRLSINSHPGEGTEVSFWLPVNLKH